MLHRLLSGDLPRSRILTGVLLVIVAGLALAPFLFSGARPLNTAATARLFSVMAWEIGSGSGPLFPIQVVQPYPAR